MKERLKLIRGKLQLSQRAFCEKIGVKQSTYASFETGERELKESYIKLICQTYNINEEWLKNGNGEMFLEAYNETINEAMKIFEELSPELQEYALKQIKLIYDLQEKDKSPGK